MQTDDFTEQIIFLSHFRMNYVLISQLCRLCTKVSFFFTYQSDLEGTILCREVEVENSSN